MRIHIYEHLTTADLGDEVPASLRSEGAAMLAAITADFERLPGIELVAHNGPNTFCLLIAPEFDDLLESLSQGVLYGGGRLLGSTPAAIALTGNKLETARFWGRRGVAHPRTEPLDACDAMRLPPPWVIKPRDGAGSQATFLIRNLAERAQIVEAAGMEWPDELICQPFIAGQAASVALLLGPQQTIPLLPAWQHLSTDGRFRYEGGSLPLPKPLADRAVRVALEAVKGIDGLRGYVGVDLILGDDGDYAIEINPRLTTSYLGLRQLCQQNLAELMLRLALGETVEPPTWREGEVRFDF